MKHAFAGALHLAWRRRAGRFGGGRSTGLRALDLADLYALLDVEKPSGFTWNQLLGFDTCMQCGKYEAMCPTFTVGQPLDSKKLIQDMAIDLAGGNGAKFAGSPYPGKPLSEHGSGPHQPTVALDDRVLVDADTLWSCTTCRACAGGCPMMIEHIDAIADMYRHPTLGKDATPNKGAEVLDNLITTNNPGSFAPGGRLNWVAGLNLSPMGEKKSASVLFWVGSGALSMRSQCILRAFAKILKAAVVDFAVLGLEEHDNGDVACRLDNETTLQDLARRNITALAKYHSTRIVSCDPHSFHMLKNEYSVLGGDYQVLHHSTFIDKLLRVGALQPDCSKAGNITYHGSCCLGRYNDEYETPRNVLRALSIEVKETWHSGFRSRCHDGGGGASITDIPDKQRIPDVCMADIRETGIGLVAVDCPQYTTALEGIIAPRSEIKDIVGLVAEALIKQAEAPARKPVRCKAVAEVH